jgi:hypothetical protein
MDRMYYIFLFFILTISLGASVNIEKVEPKVISKNNLGNCVATAMENY